MNGVLLKKCGRCGEEKPATAEYFGSAKHHGDGLASHCKTCVAGRMREYNQDKKSEARARQRTYRLANEARLAERDHAYYLARKEHILARNKRWYFSHEEEQGEYRREYHESHKERKNAYTASYAKANGARRSAIQNRRRARKHGAQGSYTISDTKLQYKRQRGECYYCHVKVGENYHVDHVVPLSRGGSNGPENIVIACPPCNISKKDKLPHEWAQGGRLL